MDATDGQLLTDFTCGDTAAFEAVVRRHVDMVYAAALRATSDPGAADDVTQAVFLVLARRARSVSGYPTVAGWLLVVTRNIAATALRTRARRLRHERAAAKAEAYVTADPTLTAEDAAQFNAALARLSLADRDAIALRFFESHTFADVGLALGITEEAARKRVDRGLARLRDQLTRQGVEPGLAAVTAKATCLASPSAPTATTTAAIKSHSTASSATVLALSKAAITTLALKSAVACAVIAAIVIGVGATKVLVGRYPISIHHATPVQPAAVHFAPPQPSQPMVKEVYIGGRVERPGAYLLEPGLQTLSDALGMAKGDLGTQLTVQLSRQSGDQATFYSLRLQDVLGDPQRFDMPLQPNDRVTVSTAAATINPVVINVAKTFPIHVTIGGDLDHAGRYTLQPEHRSFRDLIAAAEIKSSESLYAGICHQGKNEVESIQVVKVNDALAHPERFNRPLHDRDRIFFRTLAQHTPPMDTDFATVEVIDSHESQTPGLYLIDAHCNTVQAALDRYRRDTHLTIGTSLYLSRHTKSQDAAMMVKALRDAYSVDFSEPLVSGDQIVLIQADTPVAVKP